MVSESTSYSQDLHFLILEMLDIDEFSVDGNDSDFLEIDEWTGDYRVRHIDYNASDDTEDENNYVRLSYDK